MVKSNDLNLFAKLVTSDDLYNMVNTIENDTLIAHSNKTIGDDDTVNVISYCIRMKDAIRNNELSNSDRRSILLEYLLHQTHNMEVKPDLGYMDYADL